MKTFASYNMTVLRGAQHRFHFVTLGKFTPKGVRLRSLGQPKDYLEVYGEVEDGPPKWTNSMPDPTEPMREPTCYIYTTKTGHHPQEGEEFLGIYLDERGDILAVYCGRER